MHTYLHHHVHAYLYDHLQMHLYDYRHLHLWLWPSLQMFLEKASHELQGSTSRVRLHLSTDDIHRYMDTVDLQVDAYTLLTAEAVENPDPEFESRHLTQYINIHTPIYNDILWKNMREWIVCACASSCIISKLDAYFVAFYWSFNAWLLRFRARAVAAMMKSLFDGPQRAFVATEILALGSNIQTAFTLTFKICTVCLWSMLLLCIIMLDVGVSRWSNGGVPALRVWSASGWQGRRVFTHAFLHLGFRKL